MDIVYGLADQYGLTMDREVLALKGRAVCLAKSRTIGQSGQTVGGTIVGFRRKGGCHMLSLDKIYHASYVLKGVARKTDVLHAPKINPEANVYLKN